MGSRDSVGEGVLVKWGSGCDSVGRLSCAVMDAGERGRGGPVWRRDRVSRRPQAAPVRPGHFLGSCHILIAARSPKPTGPPLRRWTWRECRRGEEGGAGMKTRRRSGPGRPKSYRRATAAVLVRRHRPRQGRDPEAAPAGDKLADKVKKHGDVVGPSLGSK